VSGKVAQEFGLLRIEAGARVHFDGKRRLVVHALVRAGCGAVVIAEGARPRRGGWTKPRNGIEARIRGSAP